MKRFLKLYRVSYPKLYTWVFNLIVPILILGISFAATQLGGGIPALVIALMLIPLADLMGDYFSFNGILKKNYIFGIYMSSLSGRKAMKEQILIDQGIRLLRLIVLLVLNTVLVYAVGDVPAELGSLGMLITKMMAVSLVTYIVDSLLLSVLRIIDFIVLYSVVCGVGCASAVIAFFAYAPSDSQVVASAGFFAVLIVLAAISTFSITSHVMYQFDKSFNSPEFSLDFACLEDIEYYRCGLKKSETSGKMRFTIEGRKKFLIFLAIAYGVSYIIGLFVIYAHKTQADASVLILAQMAMPMCGVLLGKLIVDRDVRYPKIPMLIALGIGALNLVIGIYSVLGNPGETFAGQASLTTAYYVNYIVTVLGSIALAISLLTSRAGSRKNLGMHNPKVAKSIVFVLIYLAAFLMRFVILIVITGAKDGKSGENILAFFDMFKDGALWINIALVVGEGIVVFIPYLGEEYGWRYYLQPLLHSKFGKVWGTLILGCAWAVWHVFVDFFYYAPDSGIQMFASQFVTCLSIGIFLAYAYMKTQNIWMATIIHFLNNNLLVLFTGGQSNDTLQNNILTWKDVATQIVGMLPFLMFIVFLAISTLKEKNLSPKQVKVGEYNG